MRKIFFIIFILFGFGFLISSYPLAESLRAVFDFDEIVEHSDIIVTGTIQSTWVDVRPFDDHKIVDTAKIRVDEWLKNEKNSDIIEIRYYGYWAQTIENLMGIHRMDAPIHRYDTGKQVLAHLSYEDSTMVMGEGYYPFYEGTFVINDDVAISQTGEQIELDSLKKTIYNNLENKSQDLVSINISESQFEEIKSNIEKTEYDICDIRLEDNKIIIDLHKFFEGSEPEKKIKSKIPSNVDYEIFYHNGYSDYFIGTETAHDCEQLKNKN